MKPELIFIIGAQRSGTTLLERMLSCHSEIKGGAEPHLLSPLAYLGIWNKVEKAPYDHILAALGQQAFVAQLPNKEADYWQACRAFCDHLYARYMSSGGHRLCLDKTPEYATVLPFINKVYPDAKYIVLTRHPVAIFSSFANSFFDGDYEIAHQHDPILTRYLPPIADFLRQTEIPFLHLRYEDFVHNPKSSLQDICQYLNLTFEDGMLYYQPHKKVSAGEITLGDPIGLQQFQSASDSSLTKWVDELQQNSAKLQCMKKLVKQLDEQDLITLGYPPDQIWQPLENGNTKTNSRQSWSLNRYKIERKLIVHGRTLVRKYSAMSRNLKRLRLACDVLLRE